MAAMVKETLVCEVTTVNSYTKYLNGYDKPAVKYTAVNIQGMQSPTSEGIRAADITFPADLPIGTRFQVTIEQIDTVEPATIHRGALPIVIEDRLLQGEQ